LDTVIDAFIQPVPDDAIAELTRILGESGDVLDHSGPRGTDVASTGAPGSLTTILSPLMCRGAGWQVRKITVPGRPAGSVDVLSVVPGYRVDLDATEARAALSSSEFVQLLAGERWTPLDALLFTRRQLRGAQGVTPLVIASILAKKMAAGLATFALDVRAAAHGNFGQTAEEATVNANRLVAVARLLGITAHCSVSIAGVAAQPYIGRGESLVAVDTVVNGDELDPWLAEHVQACLDLALLATEGAAAPSSRSLREALVGHLTAQGATEKGWDGEIARVRAQPVVEIQAGNAGRMLVDMSKVRDVIVAAQRAAAGPADPFPDPLGVTLARRPGDRVEKGDVLATVRIASGDPGQAAPLARAVRAISGTD
jgi:pyrimidine-nucleoside phosphorylase